MLVPSMQRLLATGEAADYCHISQAYLEKLRVKGGGPLFLKLGRRVLYRLNDLEAWADKHVKTSTSSEFGEHH
ncbi:helix-turn-helix domain-containing protein [Sinorhizobium meliloti]|nr:helix-turn-helix domain-containing protein [Sinorhizobium meliloti]MDX0265540.1 helix-turn-helix domain-containing protein [Sinorhizobium meliloti]MDX0352936.1 helix-turn-helix domain-containing protein [Sinorhizobium meliloti]